jgi:hypothetical protein
VKYRSWPAQLYLVQQTCEVFGHPQCLAIWAQRHTIGTGEPWQDRGNGLQIKRYIINATDRIGNRSVKINE